MGCRDDDRHIPDEILDPGIRAEVGLTGGEYDWWIGIFRRADTAGPGQKGEREEDTERSRQVGRYP